MPLAKYFGGHGKETMRKMKKHYGDKKGKSVFYATAKKQGLEPSEEFKKNHKLSK